MVDIKEKKWIDVVHAFMVISLMILIGIILMQIWGCIGFSSDIMKPVFFASSLFLGMIYVYESNKIKDEGKLFLCGILGGTILFVYEQFLIFFVLFLLNIFWDKVTTIKNVTLVFKTFIRISFFCMLTLEMYSMCTLTNDYLYNSLLEKNGVFSVVDILFTLFLIIELLLDGNKECSSDNNISMVKKRRYLEKTRLLIWCVVVVGVLFIVFMELYSMVSKSTDTLLFYLGESKNGGFMLSQDNLSEYLYYVRKVEGSVGGVFDSPASFEWILLEDGYYIQKNILYLVMYVCQIIYGVNGVILMLLLIISVLVNKIMNCGMKKSGSVRIEGR